jgi:hypothetical protein
MIVSQPSLTRNPEVCKQLHHIDVPVLYGENNLRFVDPPRADFHLNLWLNFMGLMALIATLVKSSIRPIYRKLPAQTSQILLHHCRDVFQDNRGWYRSIPQCGFIH